jgi:hypothetical protein
MSEKFLDESYSQDEQGPERPTDPDEHPRVYIHKRCGMATEMPERIMNNYLADPYFYFTGTICAHCGGGVPDAQCHWTETGENLRDYMRRLKKEKSLSYHAVRFLMPVFFGILGAWFCSVTPVGNPPRIPEHAVEIGLVVGTAGGWFVSRFIRLAMCKVGLI